MGLLLVGVDDLAKGANVVRGGAAATADNLCAAAQEVGQESGHFFWVLRIDRAVCAIELGHAGVGVGHEFFLDTAFLHCGFELLDAADGVRHAGVFAAAGFGAAVES